jgi:hypothetical protein
MSFKSLQRSKKYGVTFSFGHNQENTGVFSSTKWLLSRWYIHGAVPVKIQTSFHNPNLNSIIISKEYILFSDISFKISKFLAFNSGLNIYRLNSIFLNKLFLFSCLKK